MFSPAVRTCRNALVLNLLMATEPKVLRVILHFQMRIVGRVIFRCLARLSRAYWCMYVPFVAPAVVSQPHISTWLGSLCQFWKTLMYCEILKKSSLLQDLIWCTEIAPSTLVGRSVSAVRYATNMVLVSHAHCASWIWSSQLAVRFKNGRFFQMLYRLV